jgi:hypothetical protein
MTVMTLMTVIYRGFLDDGERLVSYRRWIFSTFQFSRSSSSCCTDFWDATTGTIVTTFRRSSRPVWRQTRTSSPMPVVWTEKGAADSW